jgi:methionyl-tRNA formyltransferase
VSPEVHPFDYVFFGSGEFAECLLRELTERDRPPIFLVTTMDRPRGRGRRIEPSAVKKRALDLGLEVKQPDRLSDVEFLGSIRSLRVPFLLVSDFGRILRPALIETPTKAALNVHPSLLPRHRGAAPIERCMMAGERITGVTIMVLDEGVDTGPIVLQESLEIGETETKGEISKKLARLGALLFLRAADGLLVGKLEPVPQLEEGASYAKKIEKTELWLNWEEDAVSLANRVNALSPHPGARTTLDGELVKLLRARPETGVSGEPGHALVRGDRMLLCAGNGSVEVLEIQPAGRKRMETRAFLSGHAPGQARSGRPG